MCDGGDCWNSPHIGCGGWTSLKVEESLTSQTSFWGARRIPPGWPNNSYYGS
jgi:hypothetical protein